MNMVDLSEIKWIFFDIGYTLFDEETSWKVRCEQQVRLPNSNGVELSAEQLLSKLETSMTEYKTKYKVVVTDLGYDKVVSYSHSYETPYPDTESTLKYLINKGYKLGIIANQGDGLTQRLAQFDLLQYFDVVVSSYDYNINKPDLELFNIALNKANAVAQSCVMIGDRLDNDVYPAKLVGMVTVRVKQGTARHQQPLDANYVADFDVDKIFDITKLF